jgi:hypothetical protein
MKFCKNMGRVVAISDPEWTPFWVNYKMLKKLIKELPTVENSQGAPDAQKKILKSAGESTFFRLLHQEFNKAEKFFAKAQEEFAIRQERVEEGMKCMKQPGSSMVAERWTQLAKALHRFYKDLLLLENFAIMTYCSFSKILKKHDKCTGYTTREAFMTKVVSKAKFTNYPVVIEMISNTQRMFGEVATRLKLDGKEDLHRDEKLFISMISKLNQQATSMQQEEASDVGGSNSSTASGGDGGSSSSSVSTVMLQQVGSSSSSSSSESSSAEKKKSEKDSQKDSDDDDDGQNGFGSNDDDSGGDDSIEQKTNKLRQLVEENEKEASDKLAAAAIAAAAAKDKMDSKGKADECNGSSSSSSNGNKQKRKAAAASSSSLSGSSKQGASTSPSRSTRQKVGVA